MAPGLGAGVLGRPPLLPGGELAPGCTGCGPAAWGGVIEVTRELPGVSAFMRLANGDTPASAGDSSQGCSPASWLLPSIPIKAGFRVMASEKGR